VTTWLVSKHGHIPVTPELIPYIGLSIARGGLMKFTFYAEPGTLVSFADGDHKAREIEFPASGKVDVNADDVAAVAILHNSHAVSTEPPKSAAKSPKE
jgi:hypothetical protein